MKIYQPEKIYWCVTKSDRGKKKIWEKDNSYL